jgi:glycosyltransferase involved in cell wall biosynthesis
MRVGISLLTFASGDLGGSETYVRQLLKTFAAEGAHDYTVFVPSQASDAAGGLPTVEVSETPAARRGAARIPAIALAARRSREVKTQLETIDALHYLLTVPLPGTTAPTVVTLHDLQHRDLPDFFGPARRSFRRIAYDRAARNAHAVIVTSEFVRRRALELLELDSTRVHVIPHAIDHSRFKPATEEREPFLLYPARPWPHKNHPRLFEAFAALRPGRSRLRLVLTGGGLERLQPLPEGVEALGQVSASALASLYRRAACLVYPSLYEGFGLPLLEAMASGCPVAAADVGGIPEVCGDAAVLFDPTDPEAIAAAIVEADDRADELRAKGIEQAAKFTWSETARRHDDVYREVATEPPL